MMTLYNLRCRLRRQLSKVHLEDRPLARKETSWLTRYLYEAYNVSCYFIKFLFRVEDFCEYPSVP